MHREFLMGNEAIALGAIAAGVNLVCGYPGTPSTEVLETVAKRRGENTYVEWSVNEKSAMEVAVGAAYAGGRALVTMKQMGLNVAADPLMCVEYIGVKGGLVVLVADDPGPISSQTEQDTRSFASFSKVPTFDPSSAQEAYEMIQKAFAFSEEYQTPVFLRSTTRVSHGYASIEVKDPEEYEVITPEGFVKDSKRWVIFPRLSFANHRKIEARNEALSDVLSAYEANRVYPEGESAPKKKGIATGGFSFTYVMEARRELGEVRTFKVSTPFPFPEAKAVQFLTGLDEVLCVEELDPVIERALIFVAGKYHLPVKILGKLTGHVKTSGENTRDEVKDMVASFLGLPGREKKEKEEIALPVRPPVLCAGCPHRASFYAVKVAMKGKKTIYCGDIGCYTLGNAMPLDMVDTCLCMGAGLGIAQGVYHLEKDRTCFAFVGDSTFFASAIPSVVNAVYNQASMVLVVLDNSTTAMTGHQPHPGTGKTMMGEVVSKVSIEAILRGIGLTCVETVNPMDHKKAVETVKKVASESGVKAIIFKYPCVAITKPTGRCTVKEDTCIGCKKCVREIGCPALIPDGKKVRIDEAQCTGCTLCSQLCPAGAIVGGESHA
ncbi:MAG: indolepyruvate ferredoxin oxidoreductase subunit alpha [Blautia sp.]|nr:indolepyruvate ferredoxin oxidoreductase subunit alpha [Blautia sp.]